jgi:GT2 family glycosyltransferase/glycosyltransferase involved in cell wall biosynthesis
LLEPILPLIKGGVVHSAYLREKDWRAKSVRPFHGDAFPGLPGQNKPDIVLWGVIDWRYRIQRPQHLARGLAGRGYRVFYVSTSFVNDRARGFEVEQIDGDGCLFNVRLHLKGRPRIYHAAPEAGDFKRLKASVAALLEWTGSREIVSIVQHPYWTDIAQSVPDSRLIYDCIDHHGGFDNTGEAIDALERTLLAKSDAVVVTSQWLYDLAVQHNANVRLIRNATEFERFSLRPDKVFADPQGRRVIGYIGAIASWMDIDLLQQIASAFPQCLLLLVGADESGARKRLADRDNVMLTGEIPYSELPQYLYGMDVCLLPFKVVPLTLATNPVKIYEYLSAGKPVVATDLPEMAQFGNLVQTATGRHEFIAKIRESLEVSDNHGEVVVRRAFAAENTWQCRVSDLIAVIESLPRPMVSVVVLTFNNLELTRACLDSLEWNTPPGAYEIIVVDNASTDGSQVYLQDWAAGRNDRMVILNDSNRGFAAGNNQGLAAARGEYLVLLNNDTEATQGWVGTLVNHQRRNPDIGIVGPVTDNIGNEAKISLRYKDRDEMQCKARRYTLAHMGELRSMRTLAFFCVMFPRKVYEHVGPLDEAFGLGFFEDDDYCRRIEQVGWRIMCAEDVFVHHHLSASFGKLGKGRSELLQMNQKIYEAKWGPWIPHKYR